MDLGNSAGIRFPPKDAKSGRVSFCKKENIGEEYIFGREYITHPLQRAECIPRVGRVFGDLAVRRFDGFFLSHKYTSKINLKSGGGIVYSRLSNMQVPVSLSSSDGWKVLSFDVGIKNLAYCLFEKTATKWSIADWKVIDLRGGAEPKAETPLCGFVGRTKKSVPGKICGKHAKYTKRDGFFCEKHARLHPEYKIPSKEHSATALRKLKIAEVSSLYRDLISPAETPAPLKSVMVDQLVAYYASRSFDSLPSSPTKSAKEVDLVSIGRAIKRELDAMAGHFRGLRYVLIENQISPIASRMKTVQGMLTQYFIMRSTPEQFIDIRFISSANKLSDKPKRTPGATPGETPEGESEASTPSSYRANKRAGVEYCEAYLQANPEWREWEKELKTPKKDDLADSFLQGIWFLKTHKLISCAENLKINSVSVS